MLATPAMQRGIERGMMQQQMWDDVNECATDTKDDIIERAVIKKDDLIKCATYIR